MIDTNAEMATPPVEMTDTHAGLSEAVDKPDNSKPFKSFLRSLTAGLIFPTREQPQPVAKAERVGLVIAAVGAITAVVSVFLPWGVDTGRISGYARFFDTGRYEYVETNPGRVELKESIGLDPPEEHAGRIDELKVELTELTETQFASPADEENAAILRRSAEISQEIQRLYNPMLGREFIGLAAEGGSFYGVIVLGMSVLIIFAVVKKLVQPGGNPRLFASHNVLVFSVAALIAAVAYLWTPPPDVNVSHTTGVGPWVAITAGIVTLLGATTALLVAPYSTRRPLSDKISFRQIGAGLVACALVVIAGFSGWYFDQRVQTVVSPELLEQIEELKQEAIEQPSKAAEIAAEISGLSSQARLTKTVVLNGFADGGPRLGYLGVVLALVGVALTFPAAVGILVRDELQRWRWNAAVASVGVGLMVVGGAWIGSVTRVADPNFNGGVGAFLCFVGGFLFLSTTGMLKEFARSKVYVEQ
ncbi:MAG: hypothetical protein OXI96_02435 [Acidimicrobiaceae bacterium]|nr:hypothetical protein [Acidimicrobiaceae bacterium]